jgi:hypothetical protein
MLSNLGIRTVRGSLHRSVRCFVRHELGLNILRPQERFSLFRDVLPERVGHIGRDVVPRFRGKPIEKGPIFIPDPAPREPPDRAIGRVAEQAFQGDTVRRPARGVQHAQTKLKEAVFVAPDHRGHVTVQDEAILIGQTLAVGGARYDVTDIGIAQAREEFDVARASSLLHQRSLVAIGLPYLQAKKEERNQNGNAAGK